MSLIEKHLINAINNTDNTLLKCMMIVTAIEFCGSILTGKTGPGTTENNFLAFWKSKYMKQEYHQVGDLLYKILRNGVSHSFIAKGGVFPSSEKANAKNHLQFFDNGIFIYVPQLSKDVTNTINQFLNDILENKNNLKKHYLDIIKELENIGKNEYKNFIKINKINTLSETIKGDIFIDISHAAIIDSSSTVTGSAVICPIEPRNQNL